MTICLLCYPQRFQSHRKLFDYYTEYQMACGLIATVMNFGMLKE